MVELDGGVAAVACLRPTPEGEAGRALLEEGFARMPQRQQVLWVLEDNAPARRFYERLGFTTSGEKQVLPLLGDPVAVRYRRTRS